MKKMIKMISSIRRALGFLMLMPALLILTQKIALAEPKLIPGFLFVENAYLEPLELSENQAVAHFSIKNLHADDPMVLLGLTGEMFEVAALYDSQDNMREELVINPGETLTGLRAVLSSMELSDTDANTIGINLFIRRGLLAMEAIEEINNDEGQNGAFFGGLKNREAGIPNEDEYLVAFDIRN
jgi:hypothetical protein